MGKQIGFLMDAPTELEFVNFILQSGQILFEGEFRTPQNITSLPAPYSVDSWFLVYLYKPEIGGLTLREVETSGVEYIDETRSPVIQFHRSTVVDGEREIRRGRLWVEMKYWDRSNGTYELVEKPKELDVWYQQLRRWIRKHLPMTTIERSDGRMIKEYMSPAIRKKIEEGYHPIL